MSLIFLSGNTKNIVQAEKGSCRLPPKSLPAAALGEDLWVELGWEKGKGLDTDILGLWRDLVTL